MKSLIGLYDSSNEFIGYFHNDKEIKEYISLMNERKLRSTRGWTTSVGSFSV